ncbi:MAG: hypothetical protein QG608_445 [Actinomycetota bacterium]|nr:hypothetical protein [Actinomycetota bacterium]
MPWVAGEEVLACSLPTAAEAVRICVEQFTAAGFRQGQPVGRALTFLRPVDTGRSPLSRLLRRSREIERTLVLVDDDLRGIVVRISGPLPADLAAALANGPGPAILAEPMGLGGESSWSDMLAGRSPRPPDDRREPCDGVSEDSLLGDCHPSPANPAPDTAEPDPFAQGAFPLELFAPDPFTPEAFSPDPCLPDPSLPDPCLSDPCLPDPFAPGARPAQEPVDHRPHELDLRFCETAPRVIIRPDWGNPLEAGPRGLIGRAPRAFTDPRTDPDRPPDPQLLRVLDPELSVSKTHLVFGTDHQGLWIEDQNSTNGTAIVGPGGLALRCTPWQRYVVPDGARVVIGRRCFTVEVLRTAERDPCYDR